MKAFYSPYKLKPIASLENIHLSCEGVLLRFEESQETKYSLYHPIETLGDKSLSEFLTTFNLEAPLIQRIRERAINSQKMKSLPQQALDCYYSSPSVSFLLERINEVQKEGFKTAKIKVKNFLEIEKSMETLRESGLKFIFDFNGQASIKNFEDLSAKMKYFFESCLLYLEDPFESFYDSSYKVAVDFKDYSGREDFQVLKPTAFCHPLNFKNRETSIVTSYLDHPLGQLLATYWACERQVESLAGLYSHTYFKENAYSEILNQRKASISLDAFNAFEDLLKKEKWWPL